MRLDLQDPLYPHTRKKGKSVHAPSGFLNQGPSLWLSTMKFIYLDMRLSGKRGVKAPHGFVSL